MGKDKCFCLSLLPMQRAQITSHLVQNQTLPGNPESAPAEVIRRVGELLPRGKAGRWIAWGPSVKGEIWGKMA